MAIARVIPTTQFAMHVDSDNGGPPLDPHDSMAPPASKDSSDSVLSLVTLPAIFTIVGASLSAYADVIIVSS